MIASLKKMWTDLPPVLKRFCLKALVLILVWKLSYHLYLKPHRTLDKPLTNITAATTASFVQLFYNHDTISWRGAQVLNNTTLYSTSIYLNGKRSLGIADACNALELFVLYAGFIICIPTTAKRMTLFILGGIACIFVLNILRCSGMFWFNLHKKEWFDFAHHYAFKIVVYAAIFGGWVWYCKKLDYES
jgi:exosortase/archaeosortase family protein